METKRNIFKTADLESKFNDEGFVTVDLLDESKLEELSNILYQLENQSDESNVNVKSEYKLSFFNKDAEYKMNVLNTIFDFFKPLLDPILDDYEPLIVNLFNKKPGGGEVPVHQNWTFVDESKYTSVSVWIPLCDVTRYNGTMEVVPRTHKTLTPYRSPTIPWVFQGLEKVVKSKYMQPLNMQVGQVAIIDDALLHWTSENNSDKDRRTIQLIMKPKDAGAIHYHCENVKKGRLSVLDVDAEFFASFDMNEGPKNAKVIEEIPFQYKRIKNEREFSKRIS